MLHRFYAALVAVLLFAAGCSEGADLPLSPSADGAFALFEGVDVRPVVQFAAAPDLSKPRHAEKYIRASEGGVVELNGFRVEIPAGALPADTLVTLDLPTTSDRAQYVMAEFGPHAIQFNTPVTLVFPLEGVILPSGGVHVARWESGGYYTPLSTSQSADGKSVRAQTPHFSKYVMAGG